MTSCFDSLIQCSLQNVWRGHQIGILSIQTIVGGVGVIGVIDDDANAANDVVSFFLFVSL